MLDFKNYRSAMRILLPNTKQQRKNNKEPKVWEGLFFSPESMWTCLGVPKIQTVSYSQAPSLKGCATVGL